MWIPLALLNNCTNELGSLDVGYIEVDDETHLVRMVFVGNNTFLKVLETFLRTTYGKETAEVRVDDAGNIQFRQTIDDRDDYVGESTDT